MSNMTRFWNKKNKSIVQIGRDGKINNVINATRSVHNMLAAQKAKKKGKMRKGPKPEAVYDRSFGSSYNPFQY